MTFLEKFKTEKKIKNKLHVVILCISFKMSGFLQKCQKPQVKLFKILF